MCLATFANLKKAIEKNLAFSSENFLKSKLKW